MIKMLANIVSDLSHSCSFNFVLGDLGLQRTYLTEHWGFVNGAKVSSLFSLPRKGKKKSRKYEVINWLLVLMENAALN